MLPLYSGLARAVLALIVVLFFALPLNAQTSTFTYQGRLSDTSMPASGTYQMQFALYDAATGGAQIGSTVENTAVGVSNGVFTVQLDYGPSAFTGAERSLEIRVRRTSGESYVVLDPRQRLTSAPHAIRAANAGTADNASSLGGNPAANYVQTNDPRLTDARAPSAGSANYIQNTGAQQSFSNFNISGNGTAGGTISGNTVNATTLYRLGGARILAGGSTNLFVGSGTGVANTTGISNVFIGFDAGDVNTEGGANSFLGAYAGSANTTGDYNAFVGFRAGYLNQTGIYNAFLGMQAGDSNTSSQNTFLGATAGFKNSAGGSNTFVGYRAGYWNTTGNENSFYGYNSGLTNTTGSNNTVIGHLADVVSTNLTYATAIGAGARVEASNMITLGRSGGQDRVQIPGDLRITGDLDFVGSEGISGSLIVNDPTNQGLRVQTSTPGGTVASFGGNGEFNIDAPGVAAGRLHIRENGNVGINVPGANVNNKLDVNGTVGVWTLGSGGSTALCWHTVSYAISTCSSSLRYKTNVAPFSFGMDLVKQLKPIAYNWKHDGAIDLGFGAEDVAKVNPLLAIYDANGQVEGVRYDRMSVAFVNALKEQQAQIESQNKKIEDQNKQIEALKQLVCADKKEAAVCKEDK